MNHQQQPSINLQSSEVFATLETDGAGGFLTTPVLRGLGTPVLAAPRDITFTFTEPRPSANYAVVAMGAEGTGGLFINVTSKTATGFTLLLFDNANANVNPLTANVTVDVRVSQNSE